MPNGKNCDKSLFKLQNSMALRGGEAALGFAMNSSAHWAKIKQAFGPLCTSDYENKIVYCI